MRPSVDLAYMNFLHSSAVEGDINMDLWILREYALRCDHITEFGTRSGMSTSALLSAHPGVLITYDIEDEFYKKSEVALLAAVGRHTRFEFRKQNVLEVDIEHTELLFIDTFHSYTQLLAELNRHAPRVLRYLIMHDTISYGDQGEDKKIPGLKQALRDFETAADWVKDLESYAQNGLTVLRRRA